MPHLVVAGTPENRIESRAHVMTGVGKSGDSEFARTRNEYLISFENWRSSFVFNADGAGDWSLATTNDAVCERRRRMQAALSKLRDWSGQIIFIGHSHGFENLVVGGFGVSRGKNDFNHGLVSGACFGKFLADILPTGPVPIVDVIILARWLGSPDVARPSPFIRHVLSALDAPSRRVVVHSTPRETWCDKTDRVFASAANPRSSPGGSPSVDAFSALRDEVAATKTLGKAFSKAVDERLRAVVDAKGSEALGVPITGFEDVKVLRARVAGSPRAFTSYYLDEAKMLAMDEENQAFAHLRKKRAPAAGASEGGADSGDASFDTSAIGEPSTDDGGADNADHMGSSDDSGSNSEVADQAPLKPRKRVFAAHPAAASPAKGGSGPSGVPDSGTATTAGPGDIEHRRRTESMFRANEVTVEGHGSVPYRRDPEEVHEGRDVGVEGPFSVAHRWQQESFHESRIVSIDGSHSVPQRRRYEQFAEARDSTVDGRGTLPMRAWNLSLEPQTPSVGDIPATRPPRGQQPEIFANGGAAHGGAATTNAAHQPAAGLAPIVSSAVAEQTAPPAPLGSLSLDLITVSQGVAGGEHVHNCYLAACLTIQNYLTQELLTMAEAWKKIGKVAPPKDRIRTTFGKLKLPKEFTYMAGVSYTRAEGQMGALGIALKNHWPLMLGVGEAKLSMGKIGHYVVIGGVDDARRPSMIQVLDPWAAPDDDRGRWVPIPAVGRPLEGLRASQGWSILEVYFPQKYNAVCP